LHNPENPEDAIVRRLIDFAKTIPRGRNFLGFMPFPDDAGVLPCTVYSSTYKDYSRILVCNE